MRLRYIFWTIVMVLSSTLFACSKTTSHMATQELTSTVDGGKSPVDPYMQFRMDVKKIITDSEKSSSDQDEAVTELLQGLGLATATDAANPEVASSAGVLDTDKNANEKFLRDVLRLRNKHKDDYHDRIQSIKMLYIKTFHI